MLSWIKAKRSDHPLEDAQDAKRIVEELARAEPFQALPQISGYLDAIKTAENLRPSRAVEIVDMLDRAARVPQRRLNYDYVTLGRKLTRFQDTRIWSTAFQYWAQLAEAYMFCLGAFQVGALGTQTLKPHLPKLIARAIRARAQQLKWTLLRYETVDARLWEDLNRLYAMAERLNLHTAQIQLYRAGQQDSSVQAEYLRALMLAVSAADALLPVQVEVADRIISRCVGVFEMRDKASKEMLFSIDLASPQAPGRISNRTQGTQTCRYFGATRAGKDLLTPLLSSIAEYRQIPRELNLGIHPTVEVVVDTIQHLGTQWSAEPPRRASVRKVRQEKLSVVHDYDEVVANAGGLFLEYPFVSNDEPWSLENESTTGFGATVAKPHGSWLRAGGLIAIRKDEGASWSVGVVRRVGKNREGDRTVGVQLLCHNGTAVTVLPVDNAGATKAPASLSQGGEICVLFASVEHARPPEVTILLRPGLFVPGTRMEMRAYEKRYVIKPVKVILRGEDFELARMRIEQALN